jgi:hypothetical protein
MGGRAQQRVPKDPESEVEENQAMLSKELYERERHADFVREAEHERLVQMASQAIARKPFYKPVLSVIGVKLVELGTRLQDNVETVAPGAARPQITV